MTTPGMRLIRGAFVIVGKEPDGDSVRFVADDPTLLAGLRGAERIRAAGDGSVQLRFEAVDAPELHYGDAAQPLGVQARDQLLEWMGFTGITFLAGSTIVAAAKPDRVRGAILCAAVEMNGRPVSIVLLEADAPALPDGSWIDADEAVLGRSLNGRLLAEGVAYYAVYSSTPSSSRRSLRAHAVGARDAGRGLWALDATAGFVLDDQHSIGPAGHLILPKLFRRCTDFLVAAAAGFGGNLTDWLLADAGPDWMENDLLTVGAQAQRRLSDLLTLTGNRVAFGADLLDIVFVEQ